MKCYDDNVNSDFNSAFCKTVWILTNYWQTQSLSFLLRFPDVTYSEIKT